MTKVKVTENGPYLVSGIEAVTKLPSGEAIPVKGSAALCRCGASKTKPFCDGSHKHVGFSGAKDPDRTPDRRDDYAGASISVHDNRGLCAHAGRCTDGNPLVFRLRKEPFVDPNADSAEAIVGVIRQCPSGALSYSIDGKEHREHGGDAFIGFVPNGPYVIRGGAELEGAELLEGGTTDHFTLCRCGKSKNKPFCNGAHWDVKFDEDAPDRE